jgi:NhaP-type Na+/H+ or K+/H+ antiporter
MIVEKIEILLVLLGVIGVLAVVAERVKFPFPVLLVIAGLLIGLAPNLPETKLDPQLIFLIFLPPLLFSAAWSFPWDDFRSNFMPIFGLAVGLVLVTIVCVAYAAHFLIPGMTLATAFVIGAIVSGASPQSSRGKASSTMPADSSPTNLPSPRLSPVRFPSPTPLGTSSGCRSSVLLSDCW